MDEMTVKAFAREESGTSASRRLRREGLLPGVVYSAGEKATSVQLDERELGTVLRESGSENLIVNLLIEGKQPHKALLRDIQRHPLTGAVLHVDFYEISMTQKLKVQIAIELVGEAEGTKQGGVLEHLVHAIEVECLATDLVERFEVDVSELNIGDRITVGDLGIDTSKFEVHADADLAVTAVAAPRVEEELEEGAEPEVVGEKAEGGEDAPASEEKGGS